MPTNRSSSSDNQLFPGFSGLVLEKENLGPHTSLRVGGAADYLFIPRRWEDIRFLLRHAHREKIYLLGGGTNLLVADAGVRGWVIKTSHLCGTLRLVENRIIAGAGTSLTGLIKKTAAEGFSGLEMLYGIPGTVGGALAQNAGAFGAVISDCLLSLTVLDETGSLRQYSKEDLNFSYRSGPFQKDGKSIIVEGVFELKPDDPESLKQTIQKVIQQRKRKFPLSKPTAGCIFRNPPQKPAGKLIELAGMKGVRVGGAMVSHEHANFIINTGSASAGDIYCLINSVREKVRDQFGILLETEIELWGFDTLYS